MLGGIHSYQNMNEMRLRSSRREDDEFEKRSSKRFCVGIFGKEKERNVNDEPTAMSSENEENSATVCDDNRESTTSNAGKSTTAVSDNVGSSTTAASDNDGEPCDDNRESTTSNAGKSTTAVCDNVGSSTTAASDSDGEPCDDYRESTTSNAGKSTTAVCDNVGSSTTAASDNDGEPCDDNRESTTSNAGKSTTAVCDNVGSSTTAASDVRKKGTTAITRRGIKESDKSLKNGNKKTNDSSSEENISSSEENISSSEENLSIKPGAVVWAVYGRKPSRYIGIIIPSNPRVQINTPHYRNIYWFGENTISKIATKSINHFLDPKVYKERSEVPLRATGISEAVQVICDQHKLLDNILKPTSLEQFISWIEKEHFSQCDYTIPPAILKEVEAISNKGVVIDPEDGPTRSIENVQITKFAINFGDRDPTMICLGCREVTSKKEPHPLIEGFLCRICYRRVIENHMVLRMNQKYYKYCSICGWLDKYVFCKTCKRVICRTCIMFWFEEEAYQTAAQYAFRWTCLFCVQPSDSPVYNTKLIALDVDANPQVCSLAFEEIQWPQQSEVNLSGNEEKPPLRVLSLFDGICTGMVALKNLKIKVQKYFASEIDSDAIMVTRCRFGDAVEQIGDVKEITSESIKKYLPIHLLIGGSPCNDLSRVNHSRRGLTDMNGDGSLFFEFYRVMKLIDENQGNCRTYFYLFENVSSMDAKHKNTISRFFESSPICIDAKFMAAMSRPRFFWGNIPHMGTLAKEYLLNTGDCTSCNLQDHLTPNLRRQATVKKIRTVTTNNNSLTKSDGSPQVMMAGQASTLGVTEIEKIFGFPEHYTDVMNLTPNARRRLLGKAWCVQVVQALFSPLADVF